MLPATKRSGPKFHVFLCMGVVGSKLAPLLIHEKNGKTAYFIRTEEYSCLWRFGAQYQIFVGPLATRRECHTSLKRRVWQSERTKINPRSPTQPPHAWMRLRESSNFCYSTYVKQKLQATKVTAIYALGLVNNRWWSTNAITIMLSYEPTLPLHPPPPTTH